MNKRKLIITLSIVLSLLILGSVVVYAAAYDSASDPLVALSYLTNVFKPSIDTQINSLGSRLTAAENKVSQLESTIESGGFGNFDTSEIDGRLDALESTSNTQSSELSYVKTQLDETKAALSEIRSALELLTEEAAKNSDVKALSERIDSVSAELESCNDRINTLIATYEELIELLVSERVPSENNYGYETVMLSAGERVVCEGKCSVMLRSGAGTYTFTSGGYDSTSMTDITSGSAASLEHIVIFEDGVQFDSTEASTVMIKGEYRIEQ